MRRYKIIILLTIALSLNIYFRLGTALLSFARRQAVHSVVSPIKQEISQELKTEFTKLPLEARRRLGQRRLAERLKKDKMLLAQKIRLKEKELKSYWQDDDGQTFLLEYDPYHWLRLVENVLSFGRVGDKISGGRQFDSFMLAPLGMKAEVSLHKNFHVYLSSFIFRALRFLKKDIRLNSVLFYLPVLVSSLAVIAVFFLGLSLGGGASVITGFLATLILGLARIFLGRSLPGWFDTDPYVVLFSLLATGLFYASLNAGNTRRRVGYVFAAGLSIGLFAFTWDGWWYIFDLIVFSALYYLLHLRLLSRKKELACRPEAVLMSLAYFVGFSFFFVVYFCGFPAAAAPLAGIAKALLAKDYLHSQFWPNAFYTVRELRASDLSEVIADTGGAFIFFLGLAYWMMFLLRRNYRDQKHKKFIAFLFIFWLIIVAYAATKAVRFSLLLIVPAALSAALFIKEAIDIVAARLSFGKLRGWQLISGFLASLLLLSGPWQDAAKVRQVRPWMNQELYRWLKKINLETPTNAVLNSWWDCGHWFKAIAKRRVIFDGATQNTPLAYWMARCFLTDNEEEACGILRMLNSGSHAAFRELQACGLNQQESLKILQQAILLDRQAAAVLFSRYVPDAQARDRLLRLTHQPQPAYFLVEPSLTNKISSISFLGNWDFQKADIYTQFKQLAKDPFLDYLSRAYGYNRAEAVSLWGELSYLDDNDALDWISRRTGNYKESEEESRQQDLIFFSNGAVVDKANLQVHLLDKENKRIRPKRMLYVENKTLKEVVFEDSQTNLSVLLLEEADKYRLVVCDDSLASVLFTRLYYFGGLGLKHFRSVINQRLKDKPGQLIVYQIDWSS